MIVNIITEKRNGVSVGIEMNVSKIPWLEHIDSYVRWFHCDIKEWLEGIYEF